MPSSIDDEYDGFADFLQSVAAEIYDDPKEAINPLTAVGRKRRAILTEITKQKQELDKLDNLPTEPIGPGSVIHFTKTFGGGTAYSYAGVRASSGFWYITGSRGQNERRTWVDLIGFIRNRETEEPVIYLMTDSQRIN